MTDPSALETAAREAERTAMAMRVVNLREALRQANGCIKAHAKARGLMGCLLVSCDETGRPSFRGGRKFWAEVRKLATEAD